MNYGIDPRLTVTLNGISGHGWWMNIGLFLWCYDDFRKTAFVWGKHCCVWRRHSGCHFPPLAPKLYITFTGNAFTHKYYYPTWPPACTMEVTLTSDMFCSSRLFCEMVHSQKLPVLIFLVSPHRLGLHHIIALPLFQTIVRSTEGRI